MFTLLRLAGLFTGWTLVRLSWREILASRPGGHVMDLKSMSKRDIRDLLSEAVDERTKSVLRSYL